MSSPESRLKPDHEIQLSDAASGVQPAGSGIQTRTEYHNLIAGGVPISRGETNAGDDGD